MPGWTDLKPEMASSWKVSWNVDPLPLSVPLRAAPAERAAPPPGEEPLPGAAGEHPARARAIAGTTAPAVAARCRRRSDISGTPCGVDVLRVVRGRRGADHSPVGPRIGTWLVCRVAGVIMRPARSTSRVISYAKMPILPSG